MSTTGTPPAVAGARVSVALRSRSAQIDPNPMRRKEKEVTDQRIISELLADASVCRLAMVDQGEPYIVPVNFGVSGGALYVHSAPAGRKMDALRRNPRVCFEIEGTVVITHHPQACHCGAKARSIIGYGRVEILTDEEEKRRGLDIIMAHYGKAGPTNYEAEHVARMVILRIPIESMACKQQGRWEEDSPNPRAIRQGHVSPFTSETSPTMPGGARPTPTR